MGCQCDQCDHILYLLPLVSSDPLVIYWALGFFGTISRLLQTDLSTIAHFIAYGTCEHGSLYKS